MDLEEFKILAEYPYIVDGVFYDSKPLSQNKTCKEQCDRKDCLQMLQSNAGSNYLCSKGYNNIYVEIGKFKVILNGLIFSNNISVPKGRKEVRQRWICEKSDVEAFISKVIELDVFFRQQINENTVKNFSAFHDFKTSMNILFSCAQEIIHDLPGATFEEKLDNSNATYQDLYRSLSLVSSQLRMMDIVINPSSISFGAKKIINIYRLFDKMKMLFEHLTIKKREIKIKTLPAPWIPDSLCYESIEFIPLILLDNALKYAAPDSDIELKMEREADRITVIVKNIGPLVSDQNKDRIFEKFFRDESAKKFNKDGIGVGLWMAQKILEAHGSKLNYYKNPSDTGKVIGLNVFTFDLPIYQSQSEVFG